jgi:hypothetical protein
MIGGGGLSEHFKYMNSSLWDGLLDYTRWKTSSGPVYAFDLPVAASIHLVFSTSKGQSLPAGVCEFGWSSAAIHKQIFL